MEPWVELTDKVVLVTGASSGLGREYCLDLAKAGCRIVAAARRIERLKSLCDEIGGGRAVAVELDVKGSGEAIEAAVNKAWDAFGRIDALINNAGIRGLMHTPLELSEDEWNDLFRTNVKGAWLVSKYVCRRMRDSGLGGSVINISSVAGLGRGLSPGALAYVASKSALNATTRVMALELGKYKIRVNSISPGLFKSEITEGLMAKKWFNNVAMKITPLKTYGETNPAITSLVRYLIHDSSQYITGNIFIVESGVTLAGFPIFSSL
ncbi:3-oxoacyl-[acyl-carrier-protein] reductase FabG-like [Salvia divinorum]|uniref:(+)-borneol dehydrogenase n=1 Tax=Salvia divinorum TaxID=28513 RepID=A0ABD1GRU0_SALDI